MSDTVVSRGQCLCGKVTVKANTVSTHVGVCHCGSCRNWTGGPLMTVDCGSDVTFEGEDYIKAYNSSEWAERGFCSHCGSHLFYKLKANNHYIMLAGIFTELDGLVFDHQVFIDEKPDYYAFANKTQDMTGKELFEKFAGK